MKLFSPFDLIVFFFVFSLIYFMNFCEKSIKNKDEFTIFANGEVQSVPLICDTVIVINSVEIKFENSSAKITKSNCPHQICVATNPLSQNGQIICVPNRVIVSLKKQKTKQMKVDVYAR
jgi:hypothetical protein